MEKYTVVIIGGGPAGLSTAINLLKNGIDVLLIEKENYPKQKLCGGLLTEKTMDYIKHDLDINLDRLNINTTNKVNILDNNKIIVKCTCKTNFYLVNRNEFDKILYDKFIEFGGQSICNVKAKSINPELKELKTSKEQVIKYEMLIGACGVDNALFKDIFKPIDNKAFGLEITIPMENINNTFNEVGLFDDGYFWKFPKGDQVTIGYAFTYKNQFNHKEFFTKIVEERYGYNVNPTEIKGAFLPYGKPLEVVENKDIFLVGDAGGFVEKITGEGIYYALITGAMASQNIINKTLGIVEDYNKSLTELNKYLFRANTLMKIFYRYRSIILKFVKNKNDIISFFCDVQVSYNKYNLNLYKILKNYFTESSKYNG